MTFTIPAAKHLMTASWASDGRARGIFTEGTPISNGLKTNGNLPITGNATQMRNSGNTPDGNLRGYYWEWEEWSGAPTPYDVSSDTRVWIITQQFNAPNRVEIDDLATQGFIVRIGSGSDATPINYLTFEVGGNDTIIGKAREFPRMIVIDLNVRNEEAEAGTYDNTDVQTWGIGTRQAHLGGTNNLNFFQRSFVFETSKGATDIPRFTGTSDWDDMITALGTTYSTKISHEWIEREGAVFTLACPVEVGDGSTTTNFNDNGVQCFWADNNDPADPRVRVTNQAFRFYLNLVSHATNGTATFSGAYDCGNSYPPWDHDQDDLAVVTYSSPTFKRTGDFLVGSSITGPATWDDCGVVFFHDNGVDLDGSTFKNPHSGYLVSLAA